jgi:hypothetical protein
MEHNCDCRRCGTRIGDGPKISPIRVDDGHGDRPDHRETYCPWCFISFRTFQPNEQGWIEPNGKVNTRFRGDQMAVAKCQICGWTAVSFGARPGQNLRCGMCHRGGAIPMRPNAEMQRHMDAALEEARVEQAKMLGVKLPRTRSDSRRA